MATPIQLRQVLLDAFTDLQKCDENGTLADYLREALTVCPRTEDDRVVVITTDAATKDWLLLIIIEAIATMQDQKAILVTQDHSRIGHALLAMAVPPSSFEADFLANEDWSNVCSQIQRIRNGGLSIMSKSECGTLSFMAQLEDAVRSATPDLLIIDQPTQCFPESSLGDSALRQRIPESLVKLAGEESFRIIVVEHEQPNPFDPSSSLPIIDSHG